VGLLTPARWAIAATRLATLAILGLSLLLTTEPANLQARSAPLSQSTRDLGTPDAGGVTQTDRFQNLGQVKVYTKLGQSLVDTYPLDRCHTRSVQKAAVGPGAKLESPREALVAQASG
jgi:hypothetical protein